MINPELRKYVETSLRENFDVAAVRHALIAAGWDHRDVEAAIDSVQSPAMPAQPGRAAVPATAEGHAAAPATVQAKAESVTESTTAMETATTDQKGGIPAKKLVMIGAVILVVLLGAGAGFAFYKNGLPGGGLADAALLAGLPDNLEKIEFATYDGSLSFGSEPRAAGARPFNIQEYYLDGERDLPGFADYLESIDGSYSFLPSEISVRIGVGGSTASADEEATDGKFRASADIMLADFNLSADVEAVKKGENVYFRINKFPSLFFDLSALKDKWVAITPKDSGSVSGIWVDPSDFREFLSEGREDNSQWMEQVRLMYTVAYEEGAVVVVGTPSSEKIDGRNVRRFELALAKGKIPDFYARVTRELQEEYGEDAAMEFQQETADYFASPEWGRLADYLNDNITFELWLDTKTGQPAKIAWSLRIVPPDEVQKLKDVQYVLGVELALKDINRPVAVEAPADALAWDDAAILLSGKSREEYFAEKQVRNISDIRSAIADYREHAGAYPGSLDALLLSYADLYRMSEDGRARLEGSDFFVEYYEQSMLLKVVPVDAYTKQPYDYRQVGADYSIEYVVTLPPGGTDSFLLDAVVSGTNHATSKALSTEKGPSDTDSFRFSF